VIGATTAATSIVWQFPARQSVIDLHTDDSLTSRRRRFLEGCAMVYDDDPRAPMHYGIWSKDRRPLGEPTEPPQSEAVHALIDRLAQRFPDWPAERIHERIRRVNNRHDISLAVINYVFAERQAAKQEHWPR
jgi:hypothetical protein